MQKKLMFLGLFIISLVLGHWLFNLALETTDTEESSTKPITTEEIVEILRGQLQSVQPNVRQATALALGRKGPAAKSAVDDLKVLLKDKDRTVQAAAGWALCKIEPDSSEKLDWLAKALRGQDFSSQVRALKLVKDFGPAAAPLGPELAETLRHPGMGSLFAVDDVYTTVGLKLLPALEKARATAGLKYQRSLDSQIRKLKNPKQNKTVSAKSKQKPELTYTEKRQAVRRAAQISGNTPAERLKSEDADIRRKAAERLARTSQRKELNMQAFRPLIRAMEEDPDEEVRLYAAIALSRIEPGYQKPIPALVKALEHKNKKIRMLVLARLVDCGPAARSALPTLASMLLDFAKSKDPDKRLKSGDEQAAVLKAISATGPYLSDILPELIWAMTNRDSIDTISVNSNIIIIIGRAGPAAEAATSALVNIWLEARLTTRHRIRKAVEKRDDMLKIGKINIWSSVGIKMRAGDALEQVSIGSKKAVSIAIKLLRAEGKISGSLGEDMIYNIGAPAFEPLGQCLDDSDQDFRRRVIKCLSFVGPQAIPLLKKTMKTDSDRNVRLAAAQALKKLEVDISDEQLRELRGEKVSTQHRPRTQAERIALLVATAVNPEEPIQARRFACRGLKRIGQPAAVALCRIVEDTDKPADVRCRAEMVLAWMGPAANSAVPALIGALKDSNSSIRANAAFALGRIGPRAKYAISALEKAMQDPDKLVRDKAETALRKIDPKGRVYIKPSAPEK